MTLNFDVIMDDEGMILMTMGWPLCIFWWEDDVTVLWWWGWYFDNIANGNI